MTNHLKSYLCITLLLFNITLAHSAEKLYRWKDQSGTVNYSASPPPTSCMSSDCVEIRAKLDNELKAKQLAAKKEKQEREKEQKQRQEQKRAELEDAKNRIRTCITGKLSCTFEDLRNGIQYVAVYEKQAGVLGVMGAPAHIQETGSGSVQRTYWYYRIGAHKLQLVWESGLGYDGLDQINLY